MDFAGSKPAPLPSEPADDGPPAEDPSTRPAAPERAGAEEVAAPRRSFLLPEAPPTEPDPERLQTLRLFHLTGERSPELAAAGEDWRPAALAALAPAERRWQDWPLVVHGEDLAPRSWRSLVEGSLEALAGDGKAVSILAGQVARLVRAASCEAARTPGGALPAVTAAAIDALGGELDLSTKGREELARQAQALTERLPASGRVLGLGEAAALELCLGELCRAHEQRREGFAVELRALAGRLDGRLRIEIAHGADGARPEILEAELGDAGRGFLDPSVLSRMVPSRSGARPMTDERRRRIESALETLRNGARGLEEHLTPAVVHDGSLPQGVDLAGVSLVEAADPPETAARLFDERASRFRDVLRAARIADLELRDAYHPRLHDGVVARFDWRDFTAEELALIPPVAVLLRSGQLAAGELGSLLELLASGRSVRVVVLESVRPRIEQGGLRVLGEGVDLGTLALASGEALVQRTLLHDASHLFECLERFSLSPRASVLLVGVPEAVEDAPPAELQLLASDAGRVRPRFVRDPGGGESQAECFDVSANPEPDRAWPLARIDCADAQGDERELEEAFTFAHAAALWPAGREQILVVPQEFWSSEQVELSAWLEAPAGQRRGLPFLWVVDTEGQLRRAIVTRRLALASRQRQSAWRALGELGGHRNEHARRAAERARAEESEAARSEIRRLQEAHAAEVEEVRRTSAGEAMERLAHALVELDLDAPLPPAPSLEERPAAEAPPAPVSSAEAAEPAAAAEPRAEPPEEPYIDSVLCTSCNDCININPRMFVYNENKQAIIADARAGNFEQLVRAAEKCPARCIHPGKPRPDDATATERLIARARAFD